jgi:hypothetical protein
MWTGSVHYGFSWQKVYFDFFNGSEGCGAIGIGLGAGAGVGAGCGVGFWLPLAWT